MADDAEATAEVPGAALPPELDGYIGYLVRRVFAGLSSDPADNGIAAREFVILAYLADQDAMSQLALGELFGINRTSMVSLMSGLEERGWTARTRNPADRRTYVLSITQPGREALEGMRQMMTSRDHQFADRLGAAELRRLIRLLRKLLPEEVSDRHSYSAEYLITQVHYLLRRRGDAFLAQDGLRTRHFGPLMAIEKFAPCPQQQVARYLAITEPAVAGMVEELVQAGLVLRGQDRADRRRYALELTEAGRKRLVLVRAGAERLQSSVAADLGEDGLEELRTLLRRLVHRAA
jgi:DNA-binding MarR family transcriptional regulator